MTRIMLVALGMVLAMPGLAGQAHAQELFSEIPEGVSAPEPLGVRDAYMIRSEMAILNADVLQADSLTITVFGKSYEISRSSMAAHDGAYVWSGSNDNGTDAVFVVDGTEAAGLVYTPVGTFEILPVSSNIHEVYELNMSRFPPVGVADSGATGASGSIDRNLISQLESAYIGWHEYDGQNAGSTVTIDVYAVITDKALRNYGTNARGMAHLAVGDANIIYDRNDLPIRLNLVGQEVLGDHDYRDAGSLRNDLSNLMNNDHSAFQHIHEEIEQYKADVVVMFVGDYTGSHNDDRDNKCGAAHDHLADSKNTAFAAVESVCISAHSFAQVVGYLQGAGYNKEHEINSEFDYGHGYYHAGADKRTIMSQSAGNCDDPRTSKEEICVRDHIWSTPHEDFFGTTEPAGTAENWNSRVVFVTAPHIASLRGEAQSYDSVRPTGSVTLPQSIPTRGTMQINATFSEPIHMWFPPHITITNGTFSATATMTRVSDTSYTHTHTLDGEAGRFHLVFSNARDLFGNPVVKTPMSGAKFVADAADLPDRIPPVGSTYSVDDNFQDRLTRQWTLSGDTNWRNTTPTKSVPDQMINTNKALVSDECDDSCILTLKRSIDTTKPVTISFDRYVDGMIDRDEGLYLEYSVNGGTTWNALASYTHNTENDTDRWEKSVIPFSIPEDSAMLRLRAESNRDGEHVEVDNFQVYRPADAEPDVTFSATLENTRTTINIILSKSTSAIFSSTDFELSTSRIISIANIPDSTARQLRVSEIPYDTPVTVTYVGPTIDLGGGVFLNGGTSDTAPPVSRPDRPPVINPIPAVQAVLGETATVTVAASDPDGDAITMSLSGPPEFVTIADGGDGTAVITIRPTVDSHLGTHTITVVATASSKTAQAQFAVSVGAPTDNTPPSIRAPGNIVAEATAPLTILDIGTATVTDNLDPNPVVTNDAPASFPLGVTAITWTATDASGNAAIATQTVTVRDTTPPVLSDLPGDITASAQSDTGAVVSFALPTATDIADTHVDITSTHDSGDRFPVGITTVTVTATDDSGNAATHSFDITVTFDDNDATPPSITAPADVASEATGPLTRINIGTATATDNADPNPVVTNNAPASFPLGTTTVTWTATDASGNTATATQAVTVRDTTPPSFSNLPDDIAARATSSVGAVVSFALPTAMDTADTHVDITSTHDSGDRFPVGTTTVTVTATDDSGNTAMHSFTITVTFEDATPPSITPPADVASEATGPLTRINIGTATATDNADPAPVVTNDAPASFPLGTTTVTWTATDNSGNRATAAQSVTIRDTTPPVFSNPPDDIVAFATSENGTAVYFAGPAATDLVDQDVFVVATHYPGHVFGMGVTEVSFAAVDDSDNVAVHLFSITVMPVDLISPSITAPADVAAEATGILTEADIGTAIVSDNADPAPVVTNDAPDSFPLGTTTVTWTARDAANNTAADTQSVIIRDTTPPVFAELGDVIVEATGPRTVLSLPAPILTDLADPRPDVTSDAPADAALGTITITWTARDASGNSASAPQNVTIRDTTPPAFSDLPDDVFVASAVDSVATFGLPTAADLVDGQVAVTSSHEPGSVFARGKTTVTFAATDSSGNTAESSITVTVGIPARIEGLQVTATQRSVSAQWDPFPGAEQYTATAVRVGHSFTGPTIKTGDTSVTFENLHPDSLYNLAVYPDSRFGKLASANIHTLTPPPIGGLSVVPQLDDVRITWNATEAPLYAVSILHQNGTELQSHTTKNASIVITGLEPGATYSAVVSESDWPGTASTTTFAAPLPSIVPDIVITPGLHHADIRWGSVPGATQYAVSVYAQDMDARTLTTSDTSATITGLAAGTSYTVEISRADSPLSLATASFDTLPPAPISNIIVMPGPYHAHISWDASANATHYEVILDAQGSSPSRTLVTEQTSANVTGLEPSTPYAVTIRDRDRHVTAGTVQFVTFSSVVIQNVTVVPGLFDARVSWDALDGNATYVVTLTTTGGGNTGPQTLETRNASITIMGLSPSTAYVVEVRQAGQPYSTATTTFVTLAQPSISNITINAGVRTAEITWDALEGASEYTVAIHGGGAGPRVTNTTYTTVTVAGLEPATTYTAEVRDAARPHSASSANFTTLPDVYKMHDGFESVAAWSEHNIRFSPGQSGGYGISTTYDSGRPAPAALISGDGHRMQYEASRPLDLSGFAPGDHIHLGIDYRATSDFGGSQVTNARLVLEDHRGHVIYSRTLVSGGTQDTGWRTFTANITDIIGGRTTVSVAIYIQDVWSTDWNQKVYLDNLWLDDAPRPVQAQGPGAGASATATENDPSPVQLFIRYVAANGTDGAISYAESVGLDTDDARAMLASYNAAGTPP